MKNDPKTRFAKALGKRIGTERRNQRLSRYQLSKAAGTTETAIATYEAGLRIPRADTLNSIIKALGLTEIEVI